MDAKTETWCVRDNHKLFEYYVDFNEWLDGEDAAKAREEYGVDGISVPSKAFYAGDKEAYDQAFKEFRERRRNEALNKTYFCDQFTDQHWFDRNLQRFDQLVQRLETGDVVPFIGAGLSVSGGFPTWEGHLRSQGRTAGLDTAHVESQLYTGHYEEVIAEIEGKRGRDVFIQEIRDVFGRTGTITDTTLLVAELFTDTVITTNYDRLIEQAFDTGAKNVYQLITGKNLLVRPNPDCVSIIKLHGDIKVPADCILSANQYNAAYGNAAIDLSLQWLRKGVRNHFLNCGADQSRHGLIPSFHFATSSGQQNAGILKTFCG